MPIVGRVSDGRALVAAAKELRPDVIVLDVEMPLMNGLEAGRQIKATLPYIKLVFLTITRIRPCGRSLSSRRIGVPAKQSAPSELLTAIREVLQGRSYITPLMTKGLVGSLMNPDGHHPPVC